MPQVRGGNGCQTYKRVSFGEERFALQYFHLIGNLIAELDSFPLPKNCVYILAFDFTLQGRIQKILFGRIDVECY